MRYVTSLKEYVRELEELHAEKLPGQVSFVERKQLQSARRTSRLAEDELLREIAVLVDLEKPWRELPEPVLRQFRRLPDLLTIVQNSRMRRLAYVEQVYELHQLSKDVQAAEELAAGADAQAKHRIMAYRIQMNLCFFWLWMLLVFHILGMRGKIGKLARLPLRHIEGLLVSHYDGDLSELLAKQA